MKLNKKTVDDINVKGKKVLVRCDFNVPLKDGKITDENRLVAALPTIKKLVADGGKVILCSHLGKPKGEPKPELSLAPVAVRLAELLGQPVTFAADDNVVGENAKAAVAAMKDGDIVLLQNTRYRAEETKNEAAFSEELGSLADVFVNDAFGTAHRAHASTALIAKYFPNDKMFGYLMEGEIKAIDNVLKNAERPLTAIIGGSKVSSKLAVLKNLVGKVDNLIIGGGMGYTFIKAQGGQIGLSLHEDDLIPDALAILEAAREKGVKVCIAQDAVCTQEFSNEARTEVFPSTAIPADWEGVDAGPETLKGWKGVIDSSKTILWNGPVGVFEIPKFANGTLTVAKDLAEVTAKGAYTLVGGGDSVAAVTKMGFAQKVSYVSTGGGAMLEAIEGKELPGIAAIRE